MAGRSVRLFLVDGTPQGMRTAEAGNSTGIALVSPTGLAPVGACDDVQSIKSGKAWSPCAWSVSWTISAGRRRRHRIVPAGAAEAVEAVTPLVNAGIAEALAGRFRGLRKSGRLRRMAGWE